ncbi:putative cupredoxin [Rosa chinensis]|uniref:Putative cupredoxin n=1 Tax=Rosa chinensis TaxID=74649 RepID=A0A2P6Q295_ROSCH|nr:putative cupredoxin [Rosa chinensis]
MAGLKVVFVVLAISFSLGGNWVGAQVHHVVGGDRGWDPANSDLTSWSSGKSFMVGDTLCEVCILCSTWVHSRSEKQGGIRIL